LTWKVRERSFGRRFFHGSKFWSRRKGEENGLLERGNRFDFEDQDFSSTGESYRSFGYRHFVSYPSLSSQNSKIRELNNELSGGKLVFFSNGLGKANAVVVHVATGLRSCWLQQSSRDLEALIQLVVQTLGATRDTPNNYPPHPLQITSEEQTRIHSINSHTVI